MPFDDLSALREIFFLSSSRQEFASQAERERFFATWTEHYFTSCPELIFLDRDASGVRGYLMGCFDSAAAEVFFKDRIESYAVFRDLFAQFPAHLHINVHPMARSLGVGSRLLAQFFLALERRSVPGVHIVTSLKSRNREFYRRNGFIFEQARPWGDDTLLFMGRPCPAQE